MNDWTGGLIERPRAPEMSLPTRIHVIDGERLRPAGQRDPRSVMAQVKALVEEHGELTTRELERMLPAHPAKKVAIAARNLAHLKEIRNAGKAPRIGNVGSGCAIWRAI